MGFNSALKGLNEKENYICKPTWIQARKVPYFTLLLFPKITTTNANSNSVIVD
jgi:hypothetical protein